MCVDSSETRMTWTAVLLVAALEVVAWANTLRFRRNRGHNELDDLVAFVASLTSDAYPEQREQQLHAIARCPSARRRILRAA